MAFSVMGDCGRYNGTLLKQTCFCLKAQESTCQISTLWLV